jgi:hypothetical protein
MRVKFQFCKVAMIDSLLSSRGADGVDDLISEDERRVERSTTYDATRFPHLDIVHHSVGASQRIALQYKRVLRSGSLVQYLILVSVSVSIHHSRKIT